MKKNISISLLSLFVFVISCSSPKTSDIEEQVQESKVILNNSNLSHRLNEGNLGVIGIKEAPKEDPGSANTAVMSKNAVTDVASNIPMVLIAEVSAPVHEGVTLRATHVAINGDYAYVSYNVEGSTYLGGIDVINIADPTAPVIELQAILPNTDISSISYYNNSLFIAGATNSNDVDESNPAVVIKMELQGGLPTENISLIDVSSYVATDVIANSNGIYSVSGDNGDLSKYDLNSNNIIKSIPLNDLRAIGEYNNKIIVLSGTEGIHVYDANNLNAVKSFSTSQDIVESKRTIDFYDNNVLVAEGKKGLEFYNLDSGNNSATIDLPEVTDVNIDQNEVVTNAVTVTNDHIFLANGAAGIAVHDLKDGISNISKTGTLDINGSSNYVKSKDGYVFVASGNGGFKILKVVEDDSNSSGTDIICTGLPIYTGTSWLNVNSNDPQSYSGSASLNGLNVNDDLTFCGSLAVRNGLNINSGGNFYMSGSIVQGSVHNKWNSFNINNNATFYIEGSMVIYGNMILNDGATIEFLGSGSSVTIYGDVIKNGNVTIKGDYTDTFNKL